MGRGRSREYNCSVAQGGSALMYSTRYLRLGRTGSFPHPCLFLPVRCTDGKEKRYGDRERQAPFGSTYPHVSCGGRWAEETLTGHRNPGRSSSLRTRAWMVDSKYAADLRGETGDSCLAR